MSITHVRTAIRQSFQAGLLQVTEQAGFFSTVQEVNDPPKSIEQFSQLPAINLLYGKETSDNTSDLGLEGNLRKVHNSFLVTCECWLSTAQNISLAIDNIVSDLIKYFCSNFRLTLSAIDRAFVCYYSGYTPYTTNVNVNSGKVCVDVSFTVKYRQLLKDPSILV